MEIVICAVLFACGLGGIASLFRGTRAAGKGELGRYVARRACDNGDNPCEDAKVHLNFALKLSDEFASGGRGMDAAQRRSCGDVAVYARHFNY